MDKFFKQYITSSRVWASLFLACLFTNTASALTFQQVYTFKLPPHHPSSPLIQANNGVFYGTATFGGTNDAGAIFKVNTNGAYTNIYSFFPNTSGGYPESGLVLSANGFFYGTTSFGGAKQAGTIFRVNGNGAFATLYSFANSNGVPGPLLIGKDGNLYGATTGMTSNRAGAIFKSTLAGKVTYLANFPGTNAFTPNKLMQARDGNFYGTSSTAGNYQRGVIFKVTPLGAFTQLFHFDGTNGAFPEGGLTQGIDGRLYGTTAGLNGFGTIFRITTNGIFTSLFDGSTNAIGVPHGELVQTTNGLLYGLTGQSDTNTAANFFKITTNGLLTILTNAATDYPKDGLTLAKDGNFYATTYRGGADLAGTIIKVSTNGVLTNLYTFHPPMGAMSTAELEVGPDGSLYGVSAEGGIYNDGVAFKVTPSGQFSNLFSFDDNSGSGPLAGLTQGSDGTLYGTTQYGSDYGVGNLFQITTSGTVSQLATFDGINGNQSYGKLLLASDGYFYGTTAYGGPNYNGTVFKADTNGNMTALATFDAPHGTNPISQLVEGSDGNFYGTTYQAPGTVFKVTPGGTLSTVATFTSTNSIHLTDGLVVGNDGNFYGTTRDGGNGKKGSIFKMTTAGTVTTLVHFFGTNGATPNQLMKAKDGTIFGTTANGGKFNVGTIFRLSTSGVFSNMFSFAGTNGALPLAALTQTADGSLYGVSSAGAQGGGTIFRMASLPPVITAQPISRTNYIGTAVTFSATITGATPLTYQWLKDGNPILKATKAALTLTNLQPTSAAAYSVIVSNVDGHTISSNAFLSILPKPVITQQPSGQSIYVGDSPIFGVVVSSPVPVTYQWRFKGVNLAGKTASTLTVTNAKLASAGAYSVVVKNGSGSVLSSNAILTVVSCTFTLSTNLASFDSNGGSSSVNVSTPSACAWNVSNTNSWITLNLPVGGSGSGTVTFTVAPNTNSSVQRLGLMTIANTNFTVVQNGIFTADQIAGKTLTLNLTSNSSGSTNGSTRIVASLNGETLMFIPAGQLPQYTYTYTKISTNIGTINISDVGLIQLSFTSLNSGNYNYSAFGPSTYTEAGTFVMADSKADFNGDGKPDFLFQNTDGAAALWLMNGTNYVSASLLSSELDLTWRIVGQADFNADGYWDLLYQSTGGYVAYYLMNGTNLYHSYYLNSGSPINTSLNIVGMADFNHDHQSDILLQSTNGVLLAWYLDGFNSLGTEYVNNAVSPGAAWRVVALADFNNDGQTDVLFEHTNGSLMVWYLNGVHLISSATLTKTVPVGWRIMGVNDFNNDGQMDLILESNIGALSVWLMQGTNQIGTIPFHITAPAATWRLVSPK